METSNKPRLQSDRSRDQRNAGQRNEIRDFWIVTFLDSDVVYRTRSGQLTDTKFVQRASQAEEF